MLLPEEMQQLSTLNADTTVVQVSNANKTNSMTKITKGLRSLNNDTAQFPLAGQNAVVVRGDKFRVKNNLNTQLKKTKCFLKYFGFYSCELLI
jgi:hypothetical protein